MRQCSCRCPELSNIEAGCRKHEVHPGWNHPWDRQEEQMLMTQWWQKLTMRYIRRSRKLPFKLEPLICVWTYRWLIGWPLSRKIQYLRHDQLDLQSESTESEASLWRWHRHWGEVVVFWEWKSWCSIKEPCIITTQWLASWKKFCS